MNFTKRLVGVILCLSVLMIACKKKQTETTQKDFPKKMYVNVKKGLRVRDSPYLNKQETSLPIPYLEEVTVIREENNTMNIVGVDGEWISGKWVYISSPLYGWVFSAFLSTDININHVKEEFIGNWIFYGFFCTFYSNGEFKGALLETSSTASGYWELKDDKVIINITKRMEDYGEWNVNEKEEYKYSFSFSSIILTPVKGNDSSKNSDGEKIGFLSFLPKLSTTKEDNNTVITFNKFGEGRDIFGNYQLHADYVWESYKKFFNGYQEVIREEENTIKEKD